MGTNGSSKIDLHRPSFLHRSRSHMHEVRSSFVNTFLAGSGLRAFAGDKFNIFVWAPEGWHDVVSTSSGLLPLEGRPLSLQRCQNYQMDDRLISNKPASAGCLDVRA